MQTLDCALWQDVSSAQVSHVLSELGFHHPVETCRKVDGPYSLGVSGELRFVCVIF